MSAAAARLETGTGTTTLPRLLAGMGEHALSYDAHRRLHGPLPRERDLVGVVAESGLTGRGGAAFPVGRKMEAVAAGRGRPVVVANGTEGEPASGKDKVLLAYTPHLVLDGVVLAARAIGAREAFVAVASRTAHAAVTRALAERRDPVAVRAVVAPDRFVPGEERALVQVLDGGPALPLSTPPRPFESGVGGAPTLVQNVETLAHVALIARHGADWFRSVGTRAEPGSVLVTLSGAVGRVGVYEVALGKPLAELFEEAGGDPDAVQAFLVGGYFGTWLSAEEALSARLDDASLEPLGAKLGARAIVALPREACGIAETARIARYLADQSAGQCGPCVYGLAAIADDMELIVRRRPVDEVQLQRRLGVVPGRGACHHPDGAVRFVASGLEVFAAELDRHLRGGGCRGAGTPVLPVPKRGA